ncbi:MAG TPA: hypothetical protein VGD27_18490 [Longimicrobiales bacterium]
MHYVVKRFGFRAPPAILVLFLVVLLLFGAAFWIGPFRGRPAELHLVALSADGRFTENVGIPARSVDTLPASSEATARFPLVLAVHNAGARAAQPTQLALSLPALYRVADKEGPLEYRTTVGNPLARYEVAVRSPRLEPGAAPSVLAGADTLWLEPIVPSLYCTALSDSVPEFIAAPPHDPNALARVRIFYSLEGRGIRQRQTGLLNVQLDPRLVARRPAPPPPVFETVIVKPEAPAPVLTELSYVGARMSGCGEPSQPLQLHTALWETPEGGRFFVLYHGGVPRKHLYDLNRDSIIELELWDSDTDGKFEARRPARYAIPGFIMPLPRPRPDSTATALAAADTTPLDSTWLRNFHDTLGGPLRFTGRRRATAPRVATATPAVAIAQPATPAGAPVRAEPVDSAALQIFNTSEAGPLRFVRALRGDTVRPAPRPRPRPQGPRLLGVPYRGGGQQ